MISIGGFAVLLFWTAATQAAVTLTPSADGAEARVDVSPSKGSQVSLVQVVDARTGACVATLFGGALGAPQSFVLKKGTVPPGSYKIRYREGLSIEPDGALSLPPKKKWVNPVDMAATSGALYVLDTGKERPKKAGEKVDPEIEALGGEMGTWLYKFQRDGKLDVSFAERGRLTVMEKPSGIHSVVVDEKGLIYLPYGGHDVMVFDPKGRRMDGWNIGGYNAIPLEIKEYYTPKGRATAWVGAIALGAGPRIYLCSLGSPNFATIRAYDRTKPGFDGFMYNFTENGKIVAGGDRFLTSDQQGTAYLLLPSGQIQRILDTGKELALSFISDLISDPTHKIYGPVGPCASAGLIWVAAHGPGFGPFWDSGGGGGILLFCDDGSKIALVERFGTPGVAANRLEFLNPSAVAMTPDHQELWVVEDGLPGSIEDSPPGNARVRHFKISAAHSEEAPLELRGMQ